MGLVDRKVEVVLRGDCSCCGVGSMIQKWMYGDQSGQNADFRVTSGFR
jgi:hypothetical protein